MKDEKAVSATGKKQKTRQVVRLRLRRILTEKGVDAKGELEMWLDPADAVHKEWWKWVVRKDDEEIASGRIKATKENMELLSPDMHHGFAIEQNRLNDVQEILKLLEMTPEECALYEKDEMDAKKRREQEYKEKGILFRKKQCKERWEIGGKGECGKCGTDFEEGDAIFWSYDPDFADRTFCEKCKDGLPPDYIATTTWTDKW